ncbi:MULTISPECIES: DUF4339 domain-containing protein [unclassified Microcoleus]|uniref:DUF4339 domain-containing protein n=1 Tax=unclassified Microcoleus TaxID=2642155 RepID=UPI002FD16189
MKIPSWPAWLPYPISCLKGFVLSYAFTSTVKDQFPLQTGDSLVPILIGAWIWVALLFSFFHWVFTSGANLLLTHLPQKPSFDNWRQHLTTWSSSKKPHWKEGLNAFIISFVTSILVSFVVFSVIPAPSRLDAYNNNSYELRQAMIQVRFALIPIGMTITSAYLYQYDLWARQRRAAKQEKRSQNSTAPAANPIEQELNQLRADAGATRMRPVRQATPEVADWYVFRSGKAEGPYTKLQLWEVQKITARTKVRRGEGDWQRAGEVSELTKYLTQQ